MIEIENIFFCLLAPILPAMIFLRSDARRFNVFFVFGMVAALCAGFLNPVLFEFFKSQEGSIYIAPICEELLKALPILIYILVARPRQESIITSSIAVGIGFATLENFVYIAGSGKTGLFFALLRGFSAGIMHTLCTMVLGYGMARIRDKRADPVYIFGLLSAVITNHAIFNLTATTNLTIRYFGWSFPAICVIIFATYQYRKHHAAFFSRFLSKKSFRENKSLGEI